MPRTCFFEIQSSVTFRGWVLKYIGAQHVLHVMSMAHPNQADLPQGSHQVSDGILAIKDLGIGSGWQQSKQNGDSCFKYAFVNTSLGIIGISTSVVV